MKNNNNTYLVDKPAKKITKKNTETSISTIVPITPINERLERCIDKIDDTTTLVNLQKICKDEGITVEAVCRKLKEGLDSKTPGRIDTEGEVIPGTQFDDMAVRHKYLQTAVELLRIGGKNAPVSVGNQYNTVIYEWKKTSGPRIE